MGHGHGRAVLSFPDGMQVQQQRRSLRRAQQRRQHGQLLIIMLIMGVGGGGRRIFSLWLAPRDLYQKAS